MPGKKLGPADVQLPGWRSEQAARAVSSLLKFIGKQAAESNDLLQDDDEFLYLQLALKKMPLVPQKDKPIPLPLPHPIYSPEGQEICLFVKDHQGEGHKEAKERIAKFERKGGVAKVIGLSKLRTKYESFESKRELCKLYDLFLADDRILPSLPKLIGKKFFQKKKQPIPIRLTAKDFPGQVRRACASTYMFRTSGTCVNIRVARSSHSEQQILDNLYAVLVQAVENVPKKWGNVQAVFLKTVNSVALPIFQTLPDAPVLRIDTAPAPAVPASAVEGAAAGEGAGSGIAAAKAAGKAAAAAAAGSSKSQAAAGAGAAQQPKTAASKAGKSKPAAAEADAGQRQNGHAASAGQEKPGKKAVKAEPAAPFAGKKVSGKAATAAGAEKVKAAAPAKVAGKRSSPAGKAAPGKKKAKQG